LEPGQPDRQLGKLWRIEYHYAAAAIGDHIGTEQFTRSSIVEAVANITAKLCRIIRKAGDKGYPTFLPALNLRPDVPRRRGKSEDAAYTPVERSADCPLRYRRIALFVNWKCLPTYSSCSSLGGFEQILANTKR